MWGEVREGVRGVWKCERVWGSVRKRGECEKVCSNMSGECGGKVLGECGKMSWVSVKDV